MKKMLVAFVAIACSSSQLSAQNVFKEKIEGCQLSPFCLDCGDPKATYDEGAFTKALAALNSKYNLKGVHARIAFQVLIDSLGNACVLSHTDEGKNKFTLDAIGYLNQCKWIPAMDHNKGVNASVNVVLDISEGKITGDIQRIDQKAMIANMKNPGNPVIYNKTYRYRNPSLRSYAITVWQKENSGLPYDMSQHVAVDKQDTVWYALLDGLVKFDGNKFTRLSAANSLFKLDQNINSLAVDWENNKWFCTEGDIYKYDNATWQRYETAQAGGVQDVYHVIVSPSRAILFCGSNGLGILKNGKWELLDDKKISRLPSNKIDYAYLDKEQRLWIGTFKGSIMIDSGGLVTEFNQSATPLKSTCITSMAEDDQGNLYFGLYAYGEKERNKPEEGLAVLSADGNWKHFNDGNSGMPSDHINSLLFDSFEKVVWIGTNESGLVRYDLKDGWENYHNENSKVPSSYIFDLAQDSKGRIYVSTYYGMMMIRKK